MAITGTKTLRTHVIDLMFNRCSVTKTNGKKGDGPDLPMSYKMKIEENIRKTMIKPGKNIVAKRVSGILTSYIYKNQM
jgi:hypothetical protein